jgi:hypothetical protein
MKLLSHGHSKLLFFVFTPLKLWRLKVLNPKPSPIESQALVMEESRSEHKHKRVMISMREVGGRVIGRSSKKKKWCQGWWGKKKSKGSPGEKKQCVPKKKV